MLFVQVSVGTLLAFTIVAISILILRYVPPDEVPLPSSLQESIDSVSFRYTIQEKDEANPKSFGGKINEDNNQCPQSRTACPDSLEESLHYPLIVKEDDSGNLFPYTTLFFDS